MRAPDGPIGLVRLLAALGLAGALVLATMLPLPGRRAADSDLVLRVGTDQKLQVLNPFESVTVADFEVFTLNYDLLVNFGPNIDRSRASPSRGPSPRTASNGRSRSGPG